MKKQLSTCLLSCTVLSTLTHAQALPTQTVQSFTCQSCDLLSKEPLHLEWPSKETSIKNNVNSVYKSKSFSMNVSGAQLRQGIILPITSKQPVISITTDKANSLDFPVYIKSEEFGNLLLKDAAETSVKSQKFHEDAIPAFMLKSTFANNPISLYAPKAKDAQYKIYLHEPFSNLYLSVNLDSNHYQYGDRIKANIILEDKVISYPIDKIDVNLVAPDGTIAPMSLSRNGAYQYEATANITSKINSEGANWLVHALIESNYHDQHIVRQAASAFSYAIPSVSMREVSVSKDGRKATLKFKATFSHAGRYMLQADVHKTKDKQVISSVQDGQWFNEGEQNWILVVDLPETAHDGEYYLHDLTIIDVAQLKPVYQPKNKINL